MGHVPDRVERRRIVFQPRYQVPMNMRRLVAQEFVIDLDRAILGSQDRGHSRYLLNHPGPLFDREMKEFRRMAFQDQDRPS